MEKKHTIKTSIAMLLLCLLPTGVMAQGDEDVSAPCQSTWEHYSNINESTSHVRSDNNYRVIQKANKKLRMNLQRSRSGTRFRM